MPIGYLETVNPFFGSARYFHVAMLDTPNDKLQTFLRGMSKKVITWQHWAVGAFKFLHKDIYGRGYINKRYANIANVLGIANMSTHIKINV